MGKIKSIVNIAEDKMRDGLKRELIAMNKHIAECIDKRKKFLDDNMHYFAEFQIGEEVYNCKSHAVITVKEHYRYLSDQDPLNDTCLHPHCRFSDGDNTSCHGFIHPFVSKQNFDDDDNIYYEKLKFLDTERF
jgi:hypothetical protein